MIPIYPFPNGLSLCRKSHFFIKWIKIYSKQGKIDHNPDTDYYIPQIPTPQSKVQLSVEFENKCALSPKIENRPNAIGFVVQW
jgi:hypothetical protein